MNTLATLVAHPGAPGLVHLHHPHHPASAITPTLPARCVVLELDGIEHHTQRLLYSGALNRLAYALGKEESAHAGREVLSWDAFARGLNGLWATRRGKGKGKRVEDDDEGQIVLLVTKAERLRSSLGAEWAAFTRLTELVGVVRRC